MSWRMPRSGRRSARSPRRSAESGIEPFVDSRGVSCDGALVEPVIGLFKLEVIRRDEPWRSLEDVELAVLESGFLEQ